MERFLPYGRLKSVKGNNVYVPLFFPNIGVAEGLSSWTTFHIIPLAPDKCKVIIRVKGEPMSNMDILKNAGKFLGMADSMHAKKGEGDPMESGDFMLEDIYACEQQQKSLKSRHFAVGATATVKESQVRQYQTVVKEFMEKE
jgi:Rieske 2Fe-2S family protein